jgi:RNA polymerase primary sigma factor
MLPAEVQPSGEIDDLFSTFERYPIDIYEDVSSAKAARGAAEAAGITDTEPKEEVTAEEGKLDLTPGTLEKTNDTVRMYLCEMGTVPLLTREGEQAIAKRIERGQMLVLKTISRSPIVLKAMLTIGEELRKDIRSIKEIVLFDDEKLTEEKIENKTKQTLKIIDKIQKLYHVALKQAAKLENTPKSKKRAYLRAKHALARTCIEMSELVRSIDFNPMEKKRLMDNIRHTVERLHFARARGRPARAPRRRRQGRDRQRSAQGTTLAPLGVERDRSLERGRLDRVQAHTATDPARRGRSRTGEEGADRGQPAPSCLHRQEVHQPRTGVPRPDPRGQYRPDEGSRQVRMASRLQVLHLRHLVDSPGRHPRHR